MNSAPTILRAAAVWAAPGKSFAPGEVVLDASKIAFVGDTSEALHKFPGAIEEDWTHCLLMPGMVNAHCHLELSYLRGKLQSARPNESPTECFVRWVKQLVALRPDPEGLDQFIEDSVHQGITESLRFGVTTIGDITRYPLSSRKRAACGPQRIISFGEVIGLGTQRAHAGAWIMLAVANLQLGSNLSLGISPHAPYTVEGPVLKEVMKRAHEIGLPVTMHLAELQEESQFLQSLQGPLRELWNMRGNANETLDNKIPLFDGTPIAWARHWGLLETLPLPPNLSTQHSALSTQSSALSPQSSALSTPHPPILLAHCNYLTDDDIHLLAATTQNPTPQPNPKTPHESSSGRKPGAGTQEALKTSEPPPKSSSGRKPGAGTQETLKISETPNPAKSPVSVVLCPRTRSFFNHTQKHRFRELLDAGINVCLATDSLASNPDLSLLKEAQALWQTPEAKSMTAEELLSMITCRGARALGLEAGELAPGNRADIVATKTPGKTITEALEYVIKQAPEPEAVWINAEPQNRKRK